MPGFHLDWNSLLAFFKGVGPSYLAILTNILASKTGTFVQTIGQKHYGITIKDDGSALGKPALGKFSLATAASAALQIALGATGSFEVRIGNELLNVSVVEITNSANVPSVANTNFTPGV